MFKKIRRFFQKSSSSSNDRDVERIRAQLLRCAPKDEAETRDISVPRDARILVPVPSETYKSSRSDVRRWSGDGFSRDVSWVQVNRSKRPTAISEWAVESSGSGSLPEVRVRANTHDSGYGSSDSDHKLITESSVAEQDQLRPAASEDDRLHGERDIGEYTFPPFQDDAPWQRGSGRDDNALHAQPGKDPTALLDEMIKSWIDEIAQNSPGLEFPPVRKKRESSFRDWNDILDQGIDDEDPSRIAAAGCSRRRHTPRPIRRSWDEWW